MGASTVALKEAAAAALLILLLLSLAASDLSSTSDEPETRWIFTERKAKMGQTYTGVGEEECRYAVFKNTLRRVDRTNCLRRPPLRPPTFSGLNGLSDHAAEEIFFGYGVWPEEEAYEEETRREFAGWKARYGRTYRDAGEEECRYALFKGNRRVVVELNADAAGRTAYGLNQFGDFTDEEVRARCYGRERGVLQNPETEGELSARCQALTTGTDTSAIDVERRLIRFQRVADAACNLSSEIPFLTRASYAPFQ